MNLLTPRDSGYAEARVVFNDRLAGRPAMIARCATIAEVQGALRLAREESLAVAVRGGGHSGAGWSSIEAGLVVDLTRMRSVEVDPDARTAWVGGGARAIDLIAAAGEYGLAPVTGVSAKVGLGGLLLGLGEGYLTPRYGFGADNVDELQLVTADGRVLHVSADSHPELFWAMRGAGANFGVVTAMRVRLHQAPTSAVGGWITFGPDDLRAVSRHVWDVMANGVPSYFPLALYEMDEARRPRIRIIPGHTGTSDEAERDLALLRSCAEPVSDDTRTMSYLDLIEEVGDDGPRRLVWDAFRFPFDGDAERQIDVLLEQQSELDPAAHFNLWRTVPVDPPSPAGVAPRLPGITVFCSSYWTDPADDWTHLLWAETAAAALVDAGVVDVAANTMNHVSTIDTDRVCRLYGAGAYARLQAVKAAIDPGNVFRHNCNIPPSTSASVR